MGGEHVGRCGDRPRPQVRGDALVERRGTASWRSATPARWRVRAGEHDGGALGEVGGWFGALDERGAQCALVLRVSVCVMAVLSRGAVCAEGDVRSVMCGR
ncbi:hypothetical protein MPOR_56730 (plasmid) [Mycolicibacterium poriferae]|uniref:Uncharacterized protein n=1 Tax=Mycolicibacterium poriferae TaxID=39694 RepID=A0A6N4VM68_9MYCO|nr:hypothetical protein MPOR_56730 [Mycolicibacterium poriferae]